MSAILLVFFLIITKEPFLKHDFKKQRKET